jgi:hypothetical protein
MRFLDRMCLTDMISVFSGGKPVATLPNMIEQPPKPDVPRPPEVINHPPPVNTPIPPGEPESDSRPDIHPVPPPTDPGPPVI